MKKTIAWIEDDIDELNPIMEPLVESGFVFKHPEIGGALRHVLND